MERVDPYAWKIAMWRKLRRAGYPLDKLKLGFWELWLLAETEESLNGLGN